MRIRNKKGEILVGNVIFIVLNIIYLSILITFLYTRASGAVLLEEVSAKQIALLIDGAQPGMFFYLNMEQAYDSAEENGVDFSSIITKNGNTITVKLDNEGGRAGYSYSFFNDVDVNISNITKNKEYKFIIEEKTT